MWTHLWQMCVPWIEIEAEDLFIIVDSLFLLTVIFVDSKWVCMYVCMYVYSLASISGESHIEHIN